MWFLKLDGMRDENAQGEPSHPDAVFAMTTDLRLSTMRETWVRSLGREDPLEKEMAMHSSTSAWKIPWTEEPGSYSLWGRKESDTNEVT